MALVDQVELLGAAVEDGIITRHAAAELLVEHAGGMLAMRGALNYLDGWRTMRADGAARIAETIALIDCAEQVKRAVTDEEKAAAGLRLEAELALQWEAQRQRGKARLITRMRNRRVRRITNEED